MKSKKTILLIIFALVSVILLGLFLYLFRASQNEDSLLEEDFKKEGLPSVSAGKCLILEQQYCDDWTIVKDSKGYSLFAFSLPVGTRVLAPFEGYLMAGTDLDWDWNDKTSWVVLEHDPNGVVDSFTTGVFVAGAISFEKKAQENLGIIYSTKGGSIDKEGHVIAEVVEGPAVLDNYNLLIQFMSMDTVAKSLIDDEELSKKYFINE